MMEQQYDNRTAGRTLVVHYNVHQEYRETIAPGLSGVSNAIDRAVRHTIASGIPGVVADSIRFEIE